MGARPTVAPLNRDLVDAGRKISEGRDRIEQQAKSLTTEQPQFKASHGSGDKGNEIN
jgi:hypothetical protein